MRAAMKPLKLIILAAIGGIVITLITGLLGNTPEMLVGAVWYGYPLAWLVRMVVAPQYNPWVVRPLRLIADVVFWAAIAAILLFAYTKIRKK
jgi:hypothetical protein